jgi:hypothetical protein
MPRQVTVYRVFIATPGGLDEERKCFREVIYDFNDRTAIYDDILFLPIGWELAPAAMGRPHELINQDVRKCDYTLLVLRDRWGTPPGAGGPYTSGTEEEYSVARECFDKGTMRDIAVFFGAVDPRQLSDPGEQLTKVLNFRRDLEEKRELLFRTYDAISVFKDHLRNQLGTWLRAHKTVVKRS